MIYLDNAATTLKKPVEVEQAVLHAFHTVGNSGRGAHGGALDASRIVFRTREKLAKLFHVKNPERIAFTSNATEALNAAIQGMFHPGDHVISTVCEHNSVLRPLYLIETEGVKVTYISADRQGILNYKTIEDQIKENTKAIIVTHASNLTGNMTEIECIAALAQKHDLLLIVDASQTAGAVPIDVEGMGIDVLCFTGHKGLLGPQGTGGIYVKEGVNIRPLKVGGSGVHSYDRNQPTEMPTVLEAGTLNTHGIAGLYAAIAYIEEIGVEQIRKRELELIRQFTEELRKLQDVKIYGNPDLKKRVAIVSINIGNIPSATVSDWLWENHEICVRSGAHCAPKMHEALGTVKQGTVRFSFSHFNTENEVEETVKALQEII